MLDLLFIVQNQQRYTLDTSPMNKIRVNYLDPFPKSRKGKMYILVIADTYSRFVKLFSIVSITSAESAKYLDSFIVQFGSPRVLESDRRSAFIGNEFQELLEKYDIKHHTTVARFPQPNVIAEVKMLRIVPVK